MRAAAVDQAARPVLNLATSPIPTAYTLPGAGGGYRWDYFGPDSTPSVVAPGGDGPIVDGVALGYVRKTIKTAAVSMTRLTWQFTSANPDVGTSANNALPAQAGCRYRISELYRVTVAGAPAFQRALVYRFYDAANATLTTGSTAAAAAVSNGTWTRHTAVLPTAPAGTVWVALRQGWSAAMTATIGDTSDVTGLIITDVTDRPTRDEPYFDGNTPAARWVGAVNASPSVRWPA